jgi:hypothetical protein
MAEEALVSHRSTTKLVREGDFMAEVDVDLVETEDAWAPDMALEDAYRLDDLRHALRAGDVERASRLADRIYRLTPVHPGNR